LSLERDWGEHKAKIWYLKVYLSKKWFWFKEEEDDDEDSDEHHIFSRFFFNFNKKYFNGVNVVGITIDLELIGNFFLKRTSFFHFFGYFFNEVVESCVDNCTYSLF
jgi:hypothetical protein